MKVQLLNSNIVAVQFDYNPAVVAAIKRIPGRVFDVKTKSWLFAVDGLIDKHLDTLKQVGFETADISSQIKSPRIGQNFASITPDLPIFSKLYPFQRDMTLDIVKNQNCLINSFCGSGKTACMITAAKLNNSMSNLVVCPKSVLHNWANECKKFMPEAEPYVVEGNQKQRLEVYKKYKASGAMKFLIISYDVMRLDISTINEL